MELLSQLSPEDRSLTVTWPDGRRSLFHAIWLRDNCPCPECRHASGQRLVNTFTIPADIGIKSAQMGDDGSIEIVWAGDGHTSRYAPGWLEQHAYSVEAGTRPGWKRTLWGAELQTRLPEAQYEEIVGEAGALRDWLAAVEEYGFAVLRGVPPEPGMVTKVVELFGYVRETNYGRLFDVRSMVNPNNLAYTGLPLGAHSDNPYRDPTPTVQLLHCLVSSAAGGENTVVDSFCVAEKLRASAPEKFYLLTRQPVRYHFQDQAADLVSEVTVISLDVRGRVTAVRLNNRSLAPLNLPPDVMEPYYDAYRAFARMLEDGEYQVHFKLEASDLFIVDNLRVLHGRTGFSGAGQRHLQGCYADMDGLRSKLAVLRRQDET